MPNHLHPFIGVFDSKYSVAGADTHPLKSRVWGDGVGGGLGGGEGGAEDLQKEKKNCFSFRGPVSTGHTSPVICHWFTYILWHFLSLWEPVVTARPPAGAERVRDGSPPGTSREPH